MLKTRLMSADGGCGGSEPDLRRLRAADHRLCVVAFQHAALQPLVDPPSALLVEWHRLRSQRAGAVCRAVDSPECGPLAETAARSGRRPGACGAADRHL